MSTEQQVNTLKQYLDTNENDLKTNLEIIGNLLVRISVDYLDIPGHETLDSNEFIKFIFDHRSKYGETIENATALQGLTILNWLRSE